MERFSLIGRIARTLADSLFSGWTAPSSNPTRPIEALESRTLLSAITLHTGSGGSDINISSSNGTYDVYDTSGYNSYTEAEAADGFFIDLDGTEYNPTLNVSGAETVVKIINDPGANAVLTGGLVLSVNDEAQVHLLAQRTRLDSILFNAPTDE